MLYRLEGERFNSNILEPGISYILEKIEHEKNPQLELLKMACQTINIHENKVGSGINSIKHMRVPYERNIILLFEELFCRENNFDGKDIDISERIINILKNENLYHQIEIEMEDLLAIHPVSVREELLELLYKYFRISNLLKSIKEWMILQTNKREKMKENKGRIELLSLL